MPRYQTISISIGLVPQMLIRLYCSTLWTGPYKGMKQETQIILIKITYCILEKDFQFLCFTFLLFFKKGRSSEKENVFMFVTRVVQKGFFFQKLEGEGLSKVFEISWRSSTIAKLHFHLKLLNKLFEHTILSINI